MFEEHLQKTVSLLQNNQAVGYGIAVVVVVLFYFRPKAMFKLLGSCLLLVVAFYFMTQLAGIIGDGSKFKSQMSHKTTEALGE